jgi:probable selenium-dependent hydroxylase accessory protein YqeC
MKQAPSLAAALGLDPAAAGVISLVGGGGKTTAMFMLARELKALGKKVLVTTTTNIGVPEPGECDILLLEGFKDFEQLAALPAATITCLGSGLIDGEICKVKSIAPETVDCLQAEGIFDCILVEADGAKRKPIKAPADYEPVIPSSTTLVIGVIGLDALGQPIDESIVHRSEIFCSCTCKKPGDLSDSDCIIRLILAPKGLFKNASSASGKVVLLNKADSAEQQDEAAGIAYKLAAQQTDRFGCISASLQQKQFFTTRFA